MECMQPAAAVLRAKKTYGLSPKDHLVWIASSDFNTWLCAVQLVAFEAYRDLVNLAGQESEEAGLALVRPETVAVSDHGC